MKTITLVIISILLMITAENTENVYQYDLQSIDEKNVNLGEYKGSLLLIVNTASECGFTRQYEGLQALYDKYNNQNFYVLGFPSNNFGGQEPGTNEEILQFCEMNFGVTFPLFSKIEVKGDGINPLFAYLTQADNPDFTGEVRWNFEKFLIDREGNLVRRFRSNTEPDSDELISALEKYL